MKRHRIGVGRKHRVDSALDRRVRALAREYADDVRARRRLGDAKAEYHAQLPKVKAYGALIHAGLSAREAVDYFRSVSEVP
jgi:hypothetical protein